MDKGVYAGIVTYNPKIERLIENINSIYPQVDKVIVYDNGSENIEDIKLLKNSRITILIGKVNRGIAYALNRLMEYGVSNGYKWMLSLDQDSVCDAKYVNNMLIYFGCIEDVGIYAPVIVDRKIGVIGHCPNKKFACVNTCITSGAFVNIEVWKNINGYDEKMFIDSVDFEFCYRVRKAGYKVVQIRDVTLLHELGNSHKEHFLFWRVTVKGHSAFRKYYIARNNIYYPLKHRLWLNIVKGNIRNICLLVLVILYESEKKEKCKSILRGWKDGYKLSIVKN